MLVHFGLRHEATPKRGVTVPRRAARPMLHRHKVNCDFARGRLHAKILPPVHAVNVGDALGLHPQVKAQRHDEERRTARLLVQQANGACIQVVVVVVADQHHVDPWQGRQCHGQGHLTLGPDKAEGRGAIGEVRVCQDVQAAQLPQRRGVAHPGDAGVASVGLQVGQVGLNQAHPRWILRRQSLLPSLKLPVKKAGLIGAPVVDVVVVEAVGPVVLFGGVVVGIH